MNINQMNYGNFQQGAMQPGMMRQNAQQPSMPPVADSVDFSDGANHVIELAVLPSVDGILGQVVSEGINKGSTAHITGKITTDNDTKQLAQIDYEMKPNLPMGKLNTTGSLLTDSENKIGTFINEETSQSPNSAFSAKIEGVVSPAVDNQNKNEELEIIVGMGSFSTQGTVNGFPVSNMTNVGFFGTLTQQGIIADKPFQRVINPDFSTGGVMFQGKMGEMDEMGTVGTSGNGVVIDRRIGPYHIQETITFTPAKDEQSG